MRGRRAQSESPSWSANAITLVWYLIGLGLLFLAIEFLWSWDFSLRGDQLLRRAAFITVVAALLYVFNESDDD